MKKSFVLFMVIVSTWSLYGQSQLSLGQWLHEYNKLPVNGTVLYIAAHPDDENTRLIAWLANEKKYRTAYLSLTRGDGGQNLIGKELGTELGLIRSHELAQARAIDGGEQYFTRAFDFGYSKTPEETFSKWNKDSVLADMVFVIRQLQPDYLITRFSALPSPTHGHHTASAQLAELAFDLAAQPNAFPEQFVYGVKPWQPKCLLFNASTWWNPDLSSIAAQNDSFFAVDVGGFNALLGCSYTEMAGKSRSMHKSQGFGSSEPVGEQLEYLKLIKTANVKWNKQNPWSLMPSQIKNKSVLSYFNQNLYVTHNDIYSDYLTKLVKYIKWLEKEELGFSPALKHYKLQKAKFLLMQACGLYLRVKAPELQYAEGSTIEKANLVMVNRSKFRCEIFEYLPGKNISSVNFEKFSAAPLRFQQVQNLTGSISLTVDKTSEAPWLTKGKSEFLFNSSWRDDAVQSGTEALFTIRAKFKIEGVEIETELPVIYERVDPVRGLVQNPIIVYQVPKIQATSKFSLINTENPSLPTDWFISSSNELRQVYQLQLEQLAIGQVLPLWRSNQTLSSFSDITPIPLQPIEGVNHQKIKLSLTKIDGTFQELRMHKSISYDHIGTWLHGEDFAVWATQKPKHLSKKKIAYLEGAGDDVLQSLKRFGLEITEIKTNDLDLTALSNYQVLITGIRAFNVLELNKTQRAAIDSFIYRGGHLIVQYNTSRGLTSALPAPYDFSLGRNRVTEEDAPVLLTNPQHSFFTRPYKLNQDDFAGWFQERGLYFAEKFSPEYENLIEMKDSSDPEYQKGALVTCQFGKGRFTYCGLSLFRQLPMGHPGAFKLLLNIIESNDESK